MIISIVICIIRIFLEIFQNISKNPLTLTVQKVKMTMSKESNAIGKKKKVRSITMTKQEFEKMCGAQIDNGVWVRVHEDYMESDWNKIDWWRLLGRKGLIRFYAEELEDRNNKLSELARKAIEAYDRCHSNELLDAQDRVKNYDLWGMLMRTYDMTCDMLGIDAYAETAREQLSNYLII